MKVKKILASVLGLALATSVFAGCNSGETASSGSGNGSGSASGDLIKVGIINNDPNESGYRTANDKDMKAKFTKENGLYPQQALQDGIRYSRMLRLRESR